MWRKWIRWVGWTADRLRHIWSKHKIDEHELRDAFVEPEIQPIYKKSGQGRYSVFSQTSEGRHVMAIADVVFKDDKPGMAYYEIYDEDIEDLPEKGKRGAFIVTARDMTEAEKRWFRSIQNS